VVSTPFDNLQLISDHASLFLIILTFPKIFAVTLGRGIGASESPTSINRVNCNLNHILSSLPSNIFLIKTERCATSLSTLNSSLSELERITLIFILYFFKKKGQKAKKKKKEKK
jgi:hypothetical protein